jgi:predicted kinase
MNTIYLTSGPRGSGKSTYSKKIVSQLPNTIFISRDEILIELFGKTSLDPYEGGHHYVMDILFGRLEKILQNVTGMHVILDCWNGFPQERRHIIQILNGMGAVRIICWVFVTPMDICIQWFMSKPGSKGFSESGQKRDYSLFYEEAKNIRSDGFDQVYYINPLQKFLPFVDTCTK